MSLGSRAINRLRDLYVHVCDRTRRLNAEREAYPRAMHHQAAGVLLEQLEPRLMLSGTHYVVDTLQDVSADDGLLSLREAIIASNTNEAVHEASAGSSELVDRITFAEELSGGTIALNGEQLSVTESLRIDASSLDSLTIDADGLSRVFYLSGFNAEISMLGLTITGGKIAGVSPGGGGIYANSSSFIMVDCIVQGNAVLGTSTHGGGIYTHANTSIINSVIADNILSGTSAGGGGIALWGNTSIINSTISANTVSGSSADGGGVFSWSGADLTLRNSVVAHNYDSEYQSNIYGVFGERIETNSIIGTGDGDMGFYRNPDAGDDGQWGTADDIAGDYRLLPGSRLIDAGDSALAVDADGNPLPTDLLGRERVAGDAIDIGAYEAHAITGISIAGADEVTEARTLRISCQAEYADGWVDDITDLVEWNVDSPLVSVDRGMVSASTVSADTVVQVSAQFEGFEATHDLIVRDTGNALLGISVVGAESVAEDSSASYQVLAEHEDGGVVDVTEQATLDFSSSRGVLSSDGELAVSGLAGHIDATIAASFEDVETIFGVTLINTSHVVDSLADTVDLEDNVTTLRETILAANEDEGLATIAFAQQAIEAEALAADSTWVLSDGLRIVLGGTQLEITDDLVIEGLGQDVLVIDGNDQSRVLSVSGTNTTASLSGMTVTGGSDSGITNSATLTLDSVIVSGNFDSYYGGGVYNSGALTLSNALIADNVASDCGGGVYNTYGTLHATNSTITGNTAELGGGIGSGYDSETVLANTIITGNIGGDVAASYTGQGNLIGINPGFVDAENGDYRLSDTSHAIDRGIDALAVDDEGNPLLVDADGNSRIVGDSVDAGAFEFQGTASVELEAPSTVVTTLSDASTSIDGLISLREALFYATLEGSEGTITFDSSCANGTIVLSQGALTIHEGLAIDARAVTGITIDANGLSRAVMVAGSGVEIDNVTITGGTGSDGAGVYVVVGAGLTMNNSAIVDNDGIGIYCRNNSVISLSNSSIERNTGRGVYIANSGNTVTLDNMVISDNTGGGVRNSYSTVYISNSEISRNTGYEGGGIVDDDGTVIVMNTLIADNHATGDGGGVNSDDSDLFSLANVTIAGNTADGQGGGLYSDYWGDVEVNNSIIATNQARTNSDVSGDFTGDFNYIGFDPGFVDPTNSDYRLKASSLAVDAGSNALAVDSEGSPLAADMDGQPRVVNGTVDLGAYEYQGEPVAREDASTVVTTTADVVDWADGQISLREAIVYSTWGGLGTPITFDTSLTGSTVTLSQGAIQIREPVSIDASDIGGVTIDADGKSRVFCITGDVWAIRLVGLEITGGTSDGYGGGIYFDSSHDEGLLILEGCIVKGNTSESGGGGVNIDNGSLDVTNSLIVSNIAQQEGGGIRFRGNELAVINSTVSNNEARKGGGIRFNGYDASLFRIENSLVVANCASAGEVFNNVHGFASEVTSSVIDGDATLFLDLDSGDYRLADGVAIDGGRDELAVNVNGQPLLTDVYGNPRQVDASVDMGAVETQRSGPFVLIDSRDVVFNEGEQGQIEVRLSSAPTANMTVDIALLSGDESISASNTSLVFTPDNWDQPQTVVFTSPVDDDVDWPEATFSLSVQGQERARVHVLVQDPVTFEVNSLEDVVSNGDGLFTLREAILAANTNESVDGSSVGSSEYFDRIVFDTSLSGTIALGLGELLVTESVEIMGLGSDIIGIDAQGNSRVFNVQYPRLDVEDEPDIPDSPETFAPLNVSISGLLLTGGVTQGQEAGGDGDGGGGIRFSGTELILEYMDISGNVAKEGGGIHLGNGGILNISDSQVNTNAGGGINIGSGYSMYGESLSELNILRSVVSGNTARDGDSDSSGGGISFNGHEISVVDSTISDNAGSGIYVSGGDPYESSGVADLTVVNSTLTGNIASSDEESYYGVHGGGIYYNSTGDVFIVNTQITDNTTSGRGGGIYISGGDLYESYGVADLTVINSTIAGNTANFSEDDPYYSVSAGTGIFFNDYSDPYDPYEQTASGDFLLHNTIVSGNYGSDGVVSNDSDQISGTPTDSKNSLIGGSTNQVFVNPSTGDYRLADGSPAIDAGDSTLSVDSEGVLLQADVAGNPRNMGDSIDIGAYETQHDVFVVVSHNQIAFTEGENAAIDVVMSKAPESDVMVQLVRSGSEQIHADVTELTFTPDNWDQPRAITFTFPADEDFAWPEAMFTLSVDGEVRTSIQVQVKDPVTFVVDSLEDVVADGDGLFTLREAILAANTNASVDGSPVGSDLYPDQIVFNTSLSGTIALELGELVVSDNVEIIGLGSDALTIDAQGLHRVFDITTDPDNEYDPWDTPASPSLDVRISGITVTGGTGNEEGGGILFEGNELILSSMVISGNSVESDWEDGYGTAVAARGNLTLNSSVITGNTGGTAVDSWGRVTVTQSTIAGNTGGGIDADDILLNNSIVALNDGGDEVDSDVVINSSVVGLDPGFVNPVAGDYRLRASSVAIDMGNASLAFDADGQPLTHDADGQSRVVGSGVDIGAYEFQGTPTGRETVSTEVTTLDDVVDATDGEISLREAIFYASLDPTVTEVTFSDDLPSGTITLAQGELQIMTDVHIAGFGSDRLTIDADGNSRVFHVYGLLVDAQLSGMTITGGSVSDWDDGGGILFDSNDGTLMILDANITGNTATAEGSGGGICIDSGELVLMNTTIRGNTAEKGGGINIGGGSVHLYNVVVSGNMAQNDGGGIQFESYESGELTVVNSTIAGNYAGTKGGGIRFADSDPYDPNYGNSAFTLLNSIVSFNTSGNGGYENIHGEITTLENSIVGLDPGFVRNPALGADGLWGTGDDIAGDYHLTDGSIAVNRGNNQLAVDISGQLLSTDTDGNPRLIDGRVDIGAYEHQSPSPRDPISAIVTTFDDVLDVTDGVTSLREAVLYVQQGDLDVPITFDSSLRDKTIELSLGQLSSTSNLLIDASSIGGITIDASEDSRIFNFSASDANIELRNLTLIGGASDGGAGIYNSGRLLLVDVILKDNIVGEGIYNSGQLRIERGHISRNAGGGIYNRGTLDVVNTEVSANTGTGIYTSRSGVSHLVNVTVAGNTGSGVYSYYSSEDSKAEVVIRNSIVALNTDGDLLGGGIDIHSSIVGIDPGFQNAGQNDYRLSGASIALNTGESSYVDGIYDLDLQSRIVGNAVDLGAYEYQLIPDSQIIPSTHVTTLSDTVDWGDNETSIREAIASSTLTNNTTISFDASLAGGVIKLNSGDIRIASDIIIDGSMAEGITFDAQGLSRVFHVSLCNVEFHDIVITGGDADSFSGGGIYVREGTVLLNHVRIVGNQGYNGGGIYNSDGHVTIVHSYIEDNIAREDGGGIYNDDEYLTIINSVIEGNTAGDSGGGIRTYFGGQRIYNSEISGNTARYGGGVYAYGWNDWVDIRNTTIAGNYASSSGGGIYNRDDDSSVTLRNTIVAMNYAGTYGTSSSRDVSGATTQYSSFIGSAQGEPGFVTNPQRGIDGQWGTLDDIAGDYQLLEDSIAINAGDNSLLPSDSLDIDNDGDTTEPIPLDLLGTIRIYGDSVDMGAYEYLDTAHVTGVQMIGYDPHPIVRIEFSEAIDPTSFDPTEDIVSFRGPGTAHILGHSWVDSQMVDLYCQFGQYGDYTLTVGPDILTTEGELLDGNHNGIPGEEGEDNSPHIVTMTAPYVVSHTVSDTFPAKMITLTFDRPMQEDSFDPTEDIVFQGPNGAVTVESWQWLDRTTLELFVHTSTTGEYDLTLSPNILDLSGAALDNDRDNASGELDDDTYSLQFSVASPRIAQIQPPAPMSSVNEILVHFSRDMDTSSFTVDEDIISFTVPAGTVDIVDSYWRNDRTLVLDFANQGIGTYTLQIGGNISDAWGNLLDGNEDGTAGQQDDGFTQAFVTGLPSTISEDMTIGGINAMIDIESNLTVSSGATLTILPGTTMRFKNGRSLVINSGGILNATGTAEHRVTFTSSTDIEGGTPSAGHWQGIDVNGTGHAMLMYADVRYANKGVDIDSDYAKATLHSSILRNNNYGIYGYAPYAEFTATDSLIVDNTITGVFARASSVYIFRNCTFVGNGFSGSSYSRGAMHIGATTVHLENCIVANNANGINHANSAESESTVQNSLFYNPDGTDLIWTSGGTRPDLSANGNIIVDPLFVDAANGDYRLDAHSPAIDAGLGHRASATDIEGLSRHDDLGVYNTGSGYPSYLDIGAYERQEDSVAGNLSIVDVTNSGEAFVSAGESITVQWTVANNGLADLSGTWKDKVYLSRDKSFSTNDTLLTTIAYEDGLAVGESYSQTFDVTVPEGSGVWYVLVRTGEEGTISEPTRFDNTMASAAIAVDFPALTLDADVTGSISGNEWSYFRFDSTEGNTALLNLAATSSVKFYVSQSQPPTAQEYDYVSDAEGHLRILNPTGGTYYVGVCSTPYGTNAYTVSVETTALQIRSITNPQIDASGKATIEIIGDNFDYESQVEIVGHGQTYQATVHVTDASTIYATFDFEGQTVELGQYSLQVISADSSQTQMDNAIEVLDVSESDLDIQVQMPGMTRPGRWVTFGVTYTNNSSHDLYAPLLKAYTDEETYWQIPGEVDEIEGDSAWLLGISTTGPANILRPGQSETIEMKARSPLTPDRNFNVSIDYFLPGVTGQEGGNSIDWTAEYGQSPLAEMMNDSLGSTWNEYTLTLGRVAGIVSRWESPIYSRKHLELLATIEYGMGDNSDNFVSTEQNEVSFFRQNMLLGTGASEIVSSDQLTETYMGYEHQLLMWQGERWFFATEEFVASSKPTVLIIHGLDNSMGNLDWRKMAEELSQRHGMSYNILGLDWSKSAKGVQNVYHAAGDILGVAAEGARQLLELGINGSSLHIIGHSHGAHVAGMLAENYFVGGKVKRITALDASEESVHRSQLNYNGQAWGVSSAQFVDFYKSSDWMGGETAWGTDNFLLVPPEEQWGGTDERDDHRYAKEWYTKTINSSTKLGYNWGNDLLGENWGNDSWGEYLRDANITADRSQGAWKGIIRGGDNVIECLPNPLPPETNGYPGGEWEYPGGWGVSGEWNDDVATVILDDMAHWAEFSIADGVPTASTDDGVWKAGGDGSLVYSIYNSADNQSVTESLRHSAQVNMMDAIWLSSDEELNPSEDILVTFNSHGVDYVAPGYSKYFTTNVVLPGWAKIKEKLGETDSYYLLVDVGAVNSEMGIAYEGELFTANNTFAVPITIDGEALTAEAGADQSILVDSPEDTASVRLDGTASEPSELITHYEWKLVSGSIPFGTRSGSSVSMNLPVGEYEFELTVTNDNATDPELRTSTDTVTIIVQAQEEPPTDPGDDDDIGNRTSYTPEDKWGPNGYDAPGTPEGELQRFVRDDNSVGYRIEFWNKATAVVPTQDAIIIDALDPTKFDLSTLAITKVGFLDWNVDLPNVQTVDTRVDCDPTINMSVEIRGGLGMQIPGFVNNEDVGENTLAFWFHCIDPETGEWPEDPMTGFLPPFDTGVGNNIGWIEFTVDPLDNLGTGTTLENVAFVEFDFAGDIYDHPAPKVDPDVEPAEPLPWVNTIDADAPESAMLPLSANQYQELFMVSWAGTDVGSGVASYDVYMQKDEGTWTLWLDDTTETIGWYTGTKGSDYAFYSVATDNVGHAELPPAGFIPDATTSVFQDAQLTLGEGQALNEGDEFVLSGQIENMVPGSTATVDFGDGQGVEVTTLVEDGSYSIAHTYLNQGIHTVSFVLTDPYGVETSDTLEVTISNVAPTIDSLTGPTNVDQDQEATFNATVTDPGNDTLTYTWDFGDGSNTVSGVDMTTAAYTYLVASTYTVTLTVTDGDGGETTNTFEVTVDQVPATVEGRHVFYNGSSFDTTSDDDAIATNKSMLRPGETASFANYTSYSKGINGIIIDVDWMTGTPSASDFIFKVGNSTDLAEWTDAPAPTITVREGAGVDGTDRVVLIWEDNAIENQWLQVTVLSDDNGGTLGLTETDVFYFGNAIGDTGDSTDHAFVEGNDFVRIRDNQKNFLDRATIEDTHDLNRDSFVDGTDLVLARDNTNDFRTALKLLTAPQPVAPSPQQSLSFSMTPSMITLAPVTEAAAPALNYESLRIEPVSLRSTLGNLTPAATLDAAITPLALAPLSMPELTSELLISDAGLPIATAMLPVASQSVSNAEILTDPTVSLLPGLIREDWVA